MIRDVATLLRSFQEAEIRLIEGAGIRHAPTIGAMYEGLTAEVLKRSIPEMANLQIVSGFINDGQGNLSGQIDCIVVSGPSLFTTSKPIPLDAPVTIATLGLPDSASLTRPPDKVDSDFMIVFSLVCESGEGSTFHFKVFVPFLVLHSAI